MGGWTWWDVLGTPPEVLREIADMMGEEAREIRAAQRAR